VSTSGAVRRTRTQLRLLVYLARKSLFSSRITLVLLVLSLAAGAGFQIANTSNLTAFRASLLDENLTHGAGDVRVEPRDEARFRDGEAIASQIRALSGIRDAQPVLLFAGAIGKNGTRFFGTPIYGVSPMLFPPYHVVEGAPLAQGDREGILLGTQYRKRLGVGVGDEIELRVIFGAAGAAIDDDNVGRYTMKVRGIVGGSAGAYRFAYVDRSFLGAELGEPKGASAILVHLHDHEAAHEAAARISAAIPSAEAVGWRDDDPYLLNYLSANETVTSVSYAMVIAAVSVPMWALLYIHVLRRRREIGVLVAMGFGAGEVFAIYLLQALVVAIIGCAVGAALGLGLIVYFQAHPLFQWETMVVRPLVAAGVFVGPALVITATALIAGSYPAWRAARTDPAAVLRRLE
jgi:ABC-type lipoprotein release transport system permease subunit